MSNDVPETRLNISAEAETRANLPITEKPLESFVDPDDGHTYVVVAKIGTNAQEALDALMKKPRLVPRPTKADVKPYAPLGVNAGSTVDLSLTDSHHGKVQS